MLSFWHTNSPTLQSGRKMTSLNVIFFIGNKLSSPSQFALPLKRQNTSSSRFALISHTVYHWLGGSQYTHKWTCCLVTWDFLEYFASTTQPNTQNNTWRHGRVGQPGPWNTSLTHVKNSTVTLIPRTCHSWTRKPNPTIKPKKPTIGKKGTMKPQPMLWCHLRG